MLNKQILLINKPPGPTSHDIVDEVRKITGERRVGHAGTLDPFAEGLLIILVGREATKRQSEFMKLDKEYIATLYFGAGSDTDDKTGKITPYKPEINDSNGLCESFISESMIQKVLKRFTGHIEQIPPQYSAIKIKGKKAYELARRGEKIDLKSRKITIHDIEILEYHWPLLKLKIKCSSGTYIRSLARDIGRKLKCGAYVERLIRAKIGKYSLEDAIKIDKLSNK